MHKRYIFAYGQVSRRRLTREYYLKNVVWCFFSNENRILVT